MTYSTYTTGHSEGRAVPLPLRYRISQVSDTFIGLEPIYHLDSRDLASYKDKLSTLGHWDQLTVLHGTHHSSYVVDNLPHLQFGCTSRISAFTPNGRIQGR